MLKGFSVKPKKALYINAYARQRRMPRCLHLTMSTPASSRLTGLTGFGRANQNMGVAPFQTRNAFHASVGGQVFGEACQQFLAKIRMGDFPAAELHDCLDPVAILQKTDGMILLGIVIVVIGIGTELE